MSQRGRPRRIVDGPRADHGSLVSFGDCAVTGNVPGMRNPSAPRRCSTGPTSRTATLNPRHPRRGVVPALLPTSPPVHHVVDVDVFLPGCPPSADLIYAVLDDLLAGRDARRRRLDPLRRAEETTP